MSYLSTYVDTQEEQILRKITVAAADVARDVFAEAGNTASHAERIALVSHAGPRTQDFVSFAKEIVLVLLVLNTSLTAASTDPTYKTAVAAVWTAYAQLLIAKGTITVSS